MIVLLKFTTKYIILSDKLNRQQKQGDASQHVVTQFGLSQHKTKEWLGTTGENCSLETELLGT